MTFLSKAVDALSKVDGFNGVANTFQKIIDADNGYDVAQAYAQLAAELSTGVLANALLRPAFSSLRLGLAVSGQIWKWEALSTLAGISGGLSVGAIIDWVNDQHYGSQLYDYIHPDTNDLYLRARNFVRRDPLAIDLDGDGIETVGVDAGVLFDHDADAIKTGTGWLKGDDAFVVLDRNGNGLIDSGRELFGVDTLVGTNPYTGDTPVYAADGFVALASLDANGDALFNASDAQYGNVRLWRDLNQDGISQTQELQTLAEAGITSIDLATKKATKTLPGGNQQTLVAAVAGIEGQAVALDLAHNPFYRQFPDHLDTTGVAHLPEMAGSGMLRDLQEAATLSASLASQLATLRNGYRDRQQFDTELDALLDAWAATSSLKTSAQNGVLYKTATATTKVSRGGTPGNGEWRRAA